MESEPRNLTKAFRENEGTATFRYCRPVLDRDLLWLQERCLRRTRWLRGFFEPDQVCL
jgi:hypothetical protein